jgi:hypothetical protein
MSSGFFWGGAAVVLPAANGVGVITGRLVDADDDAPTISGTLIAAQDAAPAASHLRPARLRNGGIR